MKNPIIFLPFRRRCFICCQSVTHSWGRKNENIVTPSKYAGWTRCGSLKLIDFTGRGWKYTVSITSQEAGQQVLGCRYPLLHCFFAASLALNTDQIPSIQWNIYWIMQQLYIYFSAVFVSPLGVLLWSRQLVLVESIQKRQYSLRSQGRLGHRVSVNSINQILAL